MIHCDHTGCTGHLGKFDSCRDEALYQLSLDSYDASASTGDDGGFFSLLAFTEATDVELDDRTVTVPVGVYLIQETNDGFVNVTTYDTTDEPSAILAAIENDYAQWLGDNDDR